MGDGRGPDVTYSHLTHLSPPWCGATYDPDIIQGLCTGESTLLAQYDFDRRCAEVCRDQIARRNPDLGRYDEMLPVGAPESRVTLGEGMPPSCPYRGWVRNFGYDGFS
jgi:threonine synthase